MTRSWLGLILLVSNIGIFGQIGNTNFRTFTIQDGLPTTAIQDINQDTAGFLWFSTQNGLSRFDGEHFRNYYFEPKDPNSIPSNIVFKSFLASSGTMWFATYNGICRFNPEFDNFTCYSSSRLLPGERTENIVRGIGEASDGRIFFIVETGILYSLSDGEIIEVLNLESPECKFLLVDDQDRCWIASENIIFRYNIDTKLTTQFNVRFSKDNYDPEITDIIILDSTLIISSYKSDITCLDLKTGESNNFNLKQGFFQTTSLWQDGKTLIIGTSEGVVEYDLDTENFNLISKNNFTPYGLSGNSVTDIFLDRQKNWWIATTTGLNLSYRNKGFNAVYTVRMNSNSNELNTSAILIDTLNRRWIGHSNGLNIYNSDGQIDPVNQKIDTILPFGVISEIFKIYEDSQNEIWMGSYVNGLFRYNYKTDSIKQYYSYGNDPSFPGNDVRAICEDPQGNIWLAIHGEGIIVFDKSEEVFKTIHEYYPPIPEIFDQEWAFDIEFDKKGNLWLGSSLGCYYYNFSSQGYRYFGLSSEPHSLLDNSVFEIFHDSKNNTLLATKRGLNIISEDLSGVYKVDNSNGLFNSEIQAILEDEYGKYWVSSYHGISAISRGDSGIFSVVNYDIINGLHNNYFHRSSSYISRDSILYFGGKNGYTYFRPKHILTDTIPPSLVFTDLYVFDERVEITDSKAQNKDVFHLEKHLQYCDEFRIQEKFSMIGFEFAALNFINSEKNIYQYKLEGLDDLWRNLGNRNRVYFNNLKPGNYTLHVKAANSYGVWNENPVKVAFSVVPPFWRSGYALSIYLLLILVFIFYLLRLSIQKERMQSEVRQQDELRELRTRFFMNVSHELKTPLTLISIPLKRIIQKNQIGSGAFNEELIMIYRNVNRLIRLMNQIFDFRKIELEKTDLQVSENGIIQLTNSVIDLFDFQFRQKNINFSTSFPSEEIVFHFDPDKMDKIMYNLISNSWKNTPENGKISIKAEQVIRKFKNFGEIPHLQWVIEDNGKGISENQRRKVFDRYIRDANEDRSITGGTGIGLSIVHEFVKLHHGSIQIISKAKRDGYSESFTRIILEFPIKNGLYKSEQIETKSNSAKLIEENTWLRNTFHERSNDAIDSEAIKLPEECFFNILIIDDDKDMCQLLKEEFSDSYTVILAGDGKEGIDMAMKHLPDIIISDIMMPEINGFELCKTLKTRVETSHIPIILLTGKTSDEDEMHGYTTGADAYISKPFDPAKLSSRVESLIAGRIQLKRIFLSSYGLDLQKVVPTNTDEKFIQDFLRIIHAHISDRNLGIDMITRELGMSRSKLYKKLKSISNTSVNVFIRQVRLQKAAGLLKEGGMNITEVAYSVGFDSLPYFSKCFQEEFGVSPSKYASSK